MKYTFLLRRSLVIALLAIGIHSFSQTIPPVGTIPAGDSIIVVYGVTINSGTTLISNQGSISGANFATFNTNDPKTVAPGDPTLTVVQGATPGAALDFDGTDDLVNIPHNAAFNITTLTAECWIKTTANNFPPGIMNKWASGNGWQIYQNGANLTALVSTPGPASCVVNSSGQVINDGAWHHIAFAIDASGGKIYIDGIQRGSSTWTGTPGTVTNTNPVYLGFYTGTIGTAYFQGDMDEARIWNRALCQAEIVNNMNCEIATTGSGLLANYHFNQGIAGGNNAGVTTLNDASGNAYNGTLTNFALTGATSNWVAPGGVTSGVSCAAFLTPEINVQGNSVTIADGDAIPSPTDHTDFGNASTGGGNVVRTFTIQNTGTSNLTVSGITMSGTDAGMFTVGALNPASPIAGGNSATFTVTFTPTSIGLKTATVNITNNDCDEAAYDYAVQGTGVVPAGATFVVINTNNSGIGSLRQAILDANATPNANATTPDIITFNIPGANPQVITLAAGLPTITESVFINGWSQPAWASTPVIEINGTNVPFDIGLNIQASNCIIRGLAINNFNGGRGIGLFGSFSGTWIYGCHLGVDATGMIARPNGQQGIFVSTHTNVLIGTNADGTADALERNVISANGSSGILITASNTTIAGNYIGVAADGTTPLGNGTAIRIASGSNTKIGGSNAGAGNIIAYSTSKGIIIVNGTGHNAERNAIFGNTTIGIDLGDNNLTPNDPNDPDAGANNLQNFPEFAQVQLQANGDLTVKYLVSSAVANSTYPLRIDFYKGQSGQGKTFIGSQTYSSGNAGVQITQTFAPAVAMAAGDEVVATATDANGNTSEFSAAAIVTTPGAALNFDGVDDKVVVTNSTANLANSSFTVEMWLKRGATGTTDIAFSQGGGIGNSQTLHIGFRSNNNFTFAFYNSDLDVAGPSDLLWHHWACTFDDVTKIQKIYRDGVLKGQRTAPSSFLGSGNTNLYIGDAAYGTLYGGENYFNGSIDELRVWNTTRTCDQVSQLQNCELTGSESGLLAYYKFNQGAAGGNNTGVTTLTDATANANNGTLNNFALTGATSNWVAPGGVTTGTSCSAVSAPEINVQGNSVTIADGDATPSPTDHTDFGNANTGGGTVVRTFTIQNTGTANLTVTGITMSGADAAMFTVGTLTPASPIAGGNSATFTVTFTPTSTGLKTATVHIANNDCDESDYDYAVQGTGTAAGPVTYYPRTSATDLSQVSNWTDDPTGIAGSSPANFTLPNQIFNVNNNVAKPEVLGAWTISGGSILVLNNTDSLILRPAASLTVGTGSLADFNNKSVTLKSSASGTAFIGTITGSLSNATNVTVERYLSSNNNRAYRLLTPSVNTSTNIRANWQEGVNNPNTATNLNPVPGFGTHITGSTTGANGFDATQTGQGSLFTYDPVTPAYQYINNTDVNTLNAKSGYLIFLRGDRSIDLNSNASPLPSSNTTLRATGTLLAGTQTFIGTTGNNGFDLVTNPYAAPINWASVYGASTGLTQFYTLFDPNVGSQGGYVTVPATGPTAGMPSNMFSNANLNIQSGQAFFVQASGVPVPVVNVMETHKSTDNNRDVFRIGLQTELFSSSLYYRDQFNNRINADGVTSAYNNAYDTAVDGNDAEQIANFDEDIAIRRSGKDLSIESRPLIDTRDTVPFVVARLQQRGYEWQFTASNFNAPNLSAVLVDNFLNTRTGISLSGTTVIPFTVTSNSASSAANRFMVVFEPANNSPLPVNLSSVRAYQKSKDIQVEWTAQTETNLDKYEVEKSVTGGQFSKAATVAARGTNNNPASYDWLDVNANSGNNYYRIKAISKTGEVQYSKIVKVYMGKGGSEITVYPNPVKDNVMSLSLNLPKGRYTITLTNKLGQQVFRKDIEHQGGSATQTIQLESNLAQGVYQVRVSDGENNYVQQVIKN